MYFSCRILAVLWVVVGSVLVGTPVRADASQWIGNPDRRIVLVGRIHKQWDVRLDLTFKDATISGQYVYTDRGLPLFVAGARDIAKPEVINLIESEQAVRLADSDTAKITGRWSITCDPTGRIWTGSWSSPDGKREYAVDLTLAAEYDLLRYTCRFGSTERQVPRLFEQHPALTKAVDEMADRVAQSALDYIKDVRTLPDAKDPVLLEHFERNHYYTSEDWSIDHLDSRLISMHGMVYDYSGGAHPNYGFATKNFVVVADHAKEVALADLFRADVDWLSVLQDAVIQGLKQQQADWIPKRGDKDFDELMSTDMLKPFTLAAKGLTFHFGPYQYGSYARGKIEVLLPWNKLAKVIDPTGPVGAWVK